MSLPTGVVEELTVSFPRVSGDEPAPSIWSASAEAFSPRERG